MSVIRPQAMQEADGSVTDAGQSKATACRARLAELRKNPANCGRCGKPNNNGHRTCDSCRDYHRHHNAARKTKPVTSEGRRYLDVQGVAIYLSRTPGAVYELVAKRQVPFRHHGAKLVFDRDELDAYMHLLEGVDVREAVSRMLHGGTVTPLTN